MFKANGKHSQVTIFGIHNTLPAGLKQKLLASHQHFFYSTIFCNINELDFKVLYSDSFSRPNAPINCLVAALILKHKNNWSYKELFEQIEFNILTKVALGLDAFDDIPFNEATMFNFHKRLSTYETSTSINLMELVFDNLTKHQLKQLELKTSIQRSDSLMATSNIRSYSRLELLIEVVLRVWRALDDGDKSRYLSMFSAYNGQSSNRYIYSLKASDIPHEIKKIAELFHFIKTSVISKYADSPCHRMFERAYTEHFIEISGAVELKPDAELQSSFMQSPDDLEATYREKRNDHYHGQSINIVETASTDNPLNLITDVAVTANNIDDSEVLQTRIDTIKEKTPDLKEIHTDGAYGSLANDLTFESEGITHVQTAVRGRQSPVDITIVQITDNTYRVQCPLQIVESQPSRKRNKAMFDSTICQNCPFASTCPTSERKTTRTYYFTHADYLRNKRIRTLQNIPHERRTLRSNVEATVREFSCRLTNKKLKYRGLFQAKLFAYSVAIAINFGRIFRHTESPKNDKLTASIDVFYPNILCDIPMISTQHTIKIWTRCSIKYNTLINTMFCQFNAFWNLYSVNFNLLFRGDS